MILIDLQQIAIAYFSVRIKNKMEVRTLVEEDHGNISDREYIRNGLLKTLRNVRVQFSQTYGELVLCCDSRQSWRRDVFPFYKLKRRKGRDESPVDWNAFHGDFDAIKEEFKQHLPYRLVEVEGAEGDDIISVLCEVNSMKSQPVRTLIYSSDKDFLQLQKYPHVDQYDRFRERFLKCENPVHEVREKIIRGDDGDGVPNILSADNCFAAGVRQRPMMSAKVEIWKTMEPETITDWDEETKLRWKRNQALVDLSCMPVEIKQRIARYMLDNPAPQRKNMYKYLMSVRAIDLVSMAGVF
jgi:hypothetical protein